MHVSGTILCKDMILGVRNYQTVSDSSMENAAWRAAIDMEMDSCICRWNRDRKISRFVTAGEAESVTAHEVINIINNNVIATLNDNVA